MKRRLALVTAGLAALASTVGLTVVMTSSAQAATGCRIGYSVVGQWTGGFQAEVTVANTGDAWTGWTLTFAFPDAGQTVKQSWNATFAQTGTSVTFTSAAWNGALGTGASATIGFIGATAATNPVPVAFAVNGVGCGTPAASATTSRAATTAPATSAAASTTPTASTTLTASTTPTASSPAASAPAHFALLQPGSTLPTGAACATLARAVPVAENKGVNATANATTGHTVAGAAAPLDRVDGNFTGTTGQILRWAACKWGIDEDLVKAQAAIESWWHMDTKGDWGTDPTRCPANHGLGVDGTAGSCPESYGIMQIRYPYNMTAFPGAETSTAMNLDWAFGNWRACYEGGWTWLNTVERGSQYAAGDEWGCMGVWFSGRWHTAAAEEYITRVKGYLAQRIWETTDFQQP